MKVLEKGSRIREVVIFAWLNARHDTGKSQMLVICLLS